MVCGIENENFKFGLESGFCLFFKKKKSNVIVFFIIKCFISSCIWSNECNVCVFIQVSSDVLGGHGHCGQDLELRTAVRRLV